MFFELQYCNVFTIPRIGLHHSLVVLHKYIYIQPSLTLKVPILLICGPTTPTQPLKRLECKTNINPCGNLQLNILLIKCILESFKEKICESSIICLFVNYSTTLDRNTLLIQSRRSFDVRAFSFYSDSDTSDSVCLKKSNKSSVLTFL